MKSLPICSCSNRLNYNDTGQVLTSTTLIWYRFLYMCTETPNYRTQLSQIRLVFRSTVIPGRDLIPIQRRRWFIAGSHCVEVVTQLASSPWLSNTPWWLRYLTCPIFRRRREPNIAERSVPIAEPSSVTDDMERHINVSSSTYKAVLTKYLVGIVHTKSNLMKRLNRSYRWAIRFFCSHL